MQKENFVNTGLDTETYHGYARLICDDSGRHMFPEDFSDILQFLTHSRFEGNFNWFFNIKFDFEAVVKLIDDVEILKELYSQKWLEYDTYRISYLDKKYMLIQDKYGHSYHFYDIANFIQTSLNYASQKYLGKEKYDAINSSLLNVSKKYWLENINEIIKYCIIDCRLTKELADYFINLMKTKVNFIPKKMFSKGSYSQEYFLANCYIPTINDIDENVLRYAYNTYSGGRFEICKRGYFDHVYTYDIKSAYPFQMTQLIDINQGKWFETKEFKEDAFYGYYKCNIIYYNKVISPFMLRDTNVNCYPNGAYTIMLTQNEILFVLKNFPTCEIEIIDGYVFYPSKLIYPLRQKILELYYWKNREQDEATKYMVKIILNSLYGKFIQKVGGKTGSLFNPIWATEITANTRLDLLEFVLNNTKNNRDYNLNHLIGFSTDSVHSTVALGETNRYPDWQNLGDFELDFSGEGIFIMSEVYSLWNDKKQKDRFRGLSLVVEGEKTNMLSVCGKAMCQPTYDYYLFRPMHLGECLMRKTKPIKDINVWKKFPKKIDLNGDHKRLWSDNFSNGWECFYNQHTSEPLMFMEE